MLSVNNLFEQEGQWEETDPGKDLFALLFLSFFLINIILMFFLYNSTVQDSRTTELNTATSDASVQLPQSKICRIIRNAEGTLFLTQGNKQWKIPEEIPELISEVNYIHKKGRKVLLILSPDNSIGAASLISIVERLNSAGITLEFRPLKP